MDSDPPESDRAPLAQRLGWMVLIWMLSVAALGLVAFIIKVWLNMA